MITSFLHCVLLSPMCKKMQGFAFLSFMYCVKVFVYKTNTLIFTNTVLNYSKKSAPRFANRGAS